MAKEAIKRDWKPVNILLPTTVIIALDKKAKDKASKRSIEAAKMIVLGLQIKKYLKEGRYL